MQFINTLIDSFALCWLIRRFINVCAMQIESFILDQESFSSDRSVLASRFALLAATAGQSSLSEGSCDDQISVDAETQARLEALLEAAGALICKYVSIILKQNICALMCIFQCSWGCCFWCSGCWHSVCRFEI